VDVIEVIVIVSMFGFLNDKSWEKKIPPHKKLYMFDDIGPSFFLLRRLTILLCTEIFERKIPVKN